MGARFYRTHRISKQMMNSLAFEDPLYEEDRAAHLSLTRWPSRVREITAPRKRVGISVVRAERQSFELHQSFAINCKALQPRTYLNRGAIKIMATSKPEQLVRSSTKRTREVFAADFASPQALEHTPNRVFSIPPPETASRDIAEQISISTRIRSEYEHVRELPPALAAKMASAVSTAAERRKKIKEQNAESKASDPKIHKMIEGATSKAEQAKDAQSMQLTLRAAGKGAAPNAAGPTPMRNTPSSALVRKDTVRYVVTCLSYCYRTLIDCALDKSNPNGTHHGNPSELLADIWDGSAVSQSSPIISGLQVEQGIGYAAC